MLRKSWSTLIIMLFMSLIHSIRGSDVAVDLEGRGALEGDCMRLFGGAKGSKYSPCCHSRHSRQMPGLVDNRESMKASMLANAMNRKLKAHVVPDRWSQLPPVVARSHETS